MVGAVKIIVENFAVSGMMRCPKGVRRFFHKKSGPDGPLLYVCLMHYNFKDKLRMS